MKDGSLTRKVVKPIGLTLLSIVLCVAIVAAAAIGMSYMQNQAFKETFYEITSSKVEDRLRIVQVSDLHAVQYDHLVSRVQLLKPDLIVLTGDIVDLKTDDLTQTVATCSQLAEIAPTYYIYGNHERARQFGSYLLKEDVEALAAKYRDVEATEVFRHVEDPLREKMEAAGVHVLLNEQATLQVGANTVDLFGVLTTSFEGFYGYAEDNFYQYAYQDDDHFKLMLVHEPFLVDLIQVEDWGDLILSGHTHGGVARLPFFGGLYEEFYGFLPEFLNNGKILGKYMVRDIPMIVSGGLSNKDIWRVNNQPELVIVDVTHY